MKRWCYISLGVWVPVQLLCLSVHLSSVCQLVSFHSCSQSTDFITCIYYHSPLLQYASLSSLFVSMFKVFCSFLCQFLSVFPVLHIWQSHFKFSFLYIVFVNFHNLCSSLHLVHWPWHLIYPVFILSLCKSNIIAHWNVNLFFPITQCRLVNLGKIYCHVVCKNNAVATKKLL